jgi:hypothetical protein
VFGSHLKVNLTKQVTKQELLSHTNMIGGLCLRAFLASPPPHKVPRHFSRCHFFSFSSSHHVFFLFASDSPVASIQEQNYEMSLSSIGLAISSREPLLCKATHMSLKFAEDGSCWPVTRRAGCSWIVQRMH